MRGQDTAPAYSIYSVQSAPPWHTYFLPFLAPSPQLTQVDLQVHVDLQVQLYLFVHVVQVVVQVQMYQVVVQVQMYLLTELVDRVVRGGSNLTIVPGVRIMPILTALQGRINPLEPEGHRRVIGRSSEGCWRVVLEGLEGAGSLRRGPRSLSNAL